MSQFDRVKTLGYFGRIFLVNVGLSLPSHWLRRMLLRTVAHWRLASSATVMRGCRILTLGGVEVGHRTVIGDDCLLDGRGGLRIGNDVNISGGTAIFTAGHDPRSPEFAGTNRSVDIGDRCWLASRSIVLPGTIAAEGVVLGAGAVARGTLSAWTVYAGNPATAISTRPPDAQSRLNVYRAPFM
jgi:acetyltransferase-like isoleucine patch superfamily enzyme